MSTRKRVNVSRALRVRRALRVALGERRFSWRPLDVGPGRPAAGFPRTCKTEADCLRLMHEWLLHNRPDSPSWWFFVEQRAYDASGVYSVVVDYHDVLVYRDTLFDEYYRPVTLRSRLDFTEQKRRVG